MPSFNQKNPVISTNQKMMNRLCLAVIALQIGDVFSTYLALGTGRAHEQNELLVSLADVTGASINWVVLAAKVAVAAAFFVAMRKTKATLPILAALVCVTIFYTVIVSQNIFLAIAFSAR